MTRRNFGHLPGEGDIEEILISAGELTVSVLSLGAVIRDCRLAGADHPLVLGFGRLEEYLAHSPHFGTVAGRCANRIGDGRFAIDGAKHQVSLNAGHHHLHGGFKGFGARAWTVAEVRSDSVTLALTSPDGEEGYPGRVDVTCRYSVEAPGTVTMDVRATTTEPTLVNLAQHSYFILDGSHTILDHEVQIFADSITPTDDDDIPTGEIREVAGTGFDFRTPRPIRLANGGDVVEYDKNFVIGMEKVEQPRAVARMRSPASGITLDISSTEPGVQFYTGHKLAVPVAGLDGRRYGAFAGCCFEPQHFPDAINHPGFPSPLLRPVDVYRQTSVFAFGRS